MRHLSFRGRWSCADKQVVYPCSDGYPPVRRHIASVDVNTFAIQHSAGSEVGLAALAAEVAAVRAAATAMTATGLPVTVLHAVYIPAEQTWLCTVEADEAATVIEALRRAGTSTGRVLPASLL
jgi:hypothetical protein